MRSTTHSLVMARDVKCAACASTNVLETSIPVGLCHGDLTCNLLKRGLGLLHATRSTSVLVLLPTA